MATPDQPMEGLLADIGGTNARFALCAPGGDPHSALVLACADYPSLVEAAVTYLERAAPSVLPTVGAFCIASPVQGDTVAMTNHAWRFSIESTRRTLGLQYLSVINDFVAVGLSVPRLSPRHRTKVGGGVPISNAPVAIIGPGTGLGVALLLPVEGRWHAIPTEGGHVTMTATNEEEHTVLSILRQRFGHVSAERLLSGPGLVNLYNTLAQMERTMPAPLEPGDITGRAVSGDDPLCVRTLRMFIAMLGTVAGNLTLSTGALGGVYIAGGIVPRFASTVEATSFRERFEDKGRFHDYISRVPTYIITHPYPAFLGLSGLLSA
ncbi:MAG: glucokinase [Alphaproteobacteria bacterium]|nr:glucokinase [Alphaproteobacteria bacterium]